MENTTRDFWKMIMDYKVSAIVILYELEENGKVTYTKQTLLNLYNTGVLLSILSSSDVLKFGEFLLKKILRMYLLDTLRGLLMLV